MMQQPSQQVDPAIKQIGSFFTTAVQQGQQPEQVVMSLMQQEVDQQTIAQALMLVGYQEQQLTQLFNNIADMRVKANQPASAKEITSNPQELARAEEIEDESMGLPLLDEIDPMAKSGIEIKPENKGKFTRWAKSRGMTVKEAYKKVLANKDRYPASVVKMANFARNAAGWNKAQDGTEMLEMANQFANMANTTIKDSDGNVLVGGNNQKINNQDDGVIQPDPLFVNPLAFKSGYNFSPGKALNVIREGYKDMFAGAKPFGLPLDKFFGVDGDANDDGIKDGSFMDWRKKAALNKADKYANADYTFNLDTSEENLQNVANWAQQYAKENPNAEDFIANLPIEDAMKNVEVNESGIATGANAVQKFLSEGVGDLKGAAAETYQALKEKLQKGQTGTEMKGWPEDLPKAQFAGQPGFMDFNPFSQDFDMGDYLQQFTQTDYQRDMNSIIPPVQQRSASSNEQADEIFGEDGIVVTPDPTADELFEKINMGDVDVKTGGVQGFLDRVMNSNTVKAFSDASNFAVQAADVINDYFEDKEIDKAKIDLRNSVVADNIYGTKTDPFNKRGTFDINTGLMGSEGDRTTGLYLKAGGEKLPASVDNPGFKALPPSAQQNILQNMAYGGPKGEDAYLARRDAAIKASIAQQKAKMGGEKNIVNVDSDMLAKLIAAGADIEML